MKNKILIFTVMAVLLIGITSVQAEIPPRPTTPTNTSDCDEVMYDWVVGVGNTTDSYNFTYDMNSNGVFAWSNTSNNIPRHTHVGLTTHQNMTAYVYAYNSTGNGNLSLLNLSLGYAVANCPINISGCIDRSWEFAGNVYIDLEYTDGDNDTATFDTNATFGTLDTATGIFTWIPVNQSDIGAYNWNFNVTESNATVSGFAITVGQCNSSVTIITPVSRSRGAPALTPIAILGGLALWSTIIVLASRRKRKEN